MEKLKSKALSKLASFALISTFLYSFPSLASNIEEEEKEPPQKHIKLESRDEKSSKNDGDEPFIPIPILYSLWEFGKDKKVPFLSVNHAIRKLATNNPKLWNVARTFKDLDTYNKDYLLHCPDWVKREVVKNLKINFSEIRTEEWKNFILSLHNTNICKLDLSDNDFSKVNIKELVLSLKDTKIHTLNLSGNNIGAEIKSFIPHFKETNIHTLDLSYNNSFNLWCNDLADESLQEFASALKGTQILVLGLAGSELGFEGLNLKMFASHLKDTNIHTLDLSHNNFRRLVDENPGAQEFQEFIRSLKDTKIHTLNLSNNDLGNKGIKLLAPCLKDTKIHTLNLSNNDLGNKGIKLLAPCLKETNIHTLNLSGNALGNDGIKFLVPYLKDTKIRTIDLSGNNLRNDGTKLLVLHQNSYSND